MTIVTALKARAVQSGELMLESVITTPLHLQSTTLISRLWMNWYLKPSPVNSLVPLLRVWLDLELLSDRGQCWSSLKFLKILYSWSCCCVVTDSLHYSRPASYQVSADAGKQLWSVVKLLVKGLLPSKHSTIKRELSRLKVILWDQSWEHWSWYLSWH